MKIALLGYGKMGKAIEQIALQRGHQVVARLNEAPTRENLSGAEVIIEFSRPEAAVDNISKGISLGIPVVSGTTGWLDRMPAVESLVTSHEGRFLYGSNFSLGVNLFFAITGHVTKLLQPHAEYHVHLSETHHIHKKDAPSGTAITLAEQVIANAGDRYTQWAIAPDAETNILPIEVIREDEVPGTHEVIYRSETDEIMLKHTAFSRDGFATGAVVAAEWLLAKKSPGVYSMRDVLNLPL